MSMHSLDDEVMSAARAKPIAVRLKAEPGWRAVVVEKAGEANADGLAPVQISVVRVGSWALDTSLPTSPGKPEHASAMFGLSASLFGFGGLFGSASASLWPLGADGKRLVGVHRVVPPGDATDEDLAKDAKAWLAASVEAHQKREDALARARGKAVSR
jgi:hypothetical protein